jgi:ABC-type transport system involved in cytochrome bd biosynthesis fused ATPase/permease subunit
MDYNILAALPLAEAEKILKEKGIDYSVKYVNSNLKGGDIKAVACARGEGGVLTLYVCDFKLKPDKYEQ